MSCVQARYKVVPQMLHHSGRNKLGLPCILGWGWGFTVTGALRVKEVRVKMNSRNWLCCLRLLLDQMNRGGKFLKKLWCCVGEEYEKIIWFYQLG